MHCRTIYGMHDCNLTTKKEGSKKKMYSTIDLRKLRNYSTFCVASYHRGFLMHVTSSQHIHQCFKYPNISFPSPLKYLQRSADGEDDDSEEEESGDDMVMMVSEWEYRYCGAVRPLCCRLGLRAEEVWIRLYSQPPSLTVYTLQSHGSIAPHWRGYVIEVEILLGNMLVDIILGILGILSIGYIVVLYFSTVAKEKEKVDSISFETSNDHYWASLHAHASTLRQRPTHSCDDVDDMYVPSLPRPIPAGRPPLAGSTAAVGIETPTNMYSANTGFNQLHHRKSDPPAMEPLRAPSPPKVQFYCPTGIPAAHGANYSDSSQTTTSCTKANQGGLRGSAPLVSFHGATSGSTTSQQSSSSGGRNVPLESIYPPPPLPPPGVDRSSADERRERRAQSFDITYCPAPVGMCSSGTSSSGSSCKPSPELHRRKVYTPTRHSQQQQTSQAHAYHHHHQQQQQPQQQQQQQQYRTSPDRDFIDAAQAPAGGALGDKSSSTIGGQTSRSFHDAQYMSIKMTDMTLLHVIGGGAFGQVWKATWKGTPVAVKVLSSQISASEEELQVFTDEVQMLACLRHPNICLFLGACLKPPNRYIVTELVSRGSLWEALRTPNLFSERGPADVFHWPWWVVRRVLDGTCRGLVYLHGNDPPIIHRDLKSANLLLDDSFHVKICDFGLARLRDFGHAMTANVGTTQWTAPEVLAGKDYNELADMYSVGVVAWELLTGKCPFENITNQMEIAVEVVHRKRRPPIAAHCPRRVVDLIERCWADLPDDRMSAADALTALEVAIPVN